jgi:hypothetical protein
MLIPIVKSVLCADFELNPERFKDGNFSTSVQIGIGPADHKGEEFFQFKVVSPSKIIHDVSQTGVLFMRNIIILDQIDYRLIESVVNGVIRNSAAENWDAVSLNIRKYATSEYS